MTVIVDASVVSRWYLNVDGSEQAEAVAQSDESLIAPDLVLAEVANALWKAVAFNNEPAEDAGAFMRGLSRQFAQLVPSSELVDDAWALSLELSHPAYDCFYLALAQQRNCKLVTADLRLLRRCSGSRLAPSITAL